MNETLSHNQFLDKYLRTSPDYDGVMGVQCVDGAKQYVKDVYDISLGSFGGTAYTGWLNKKKTFDPKIWEKIEWKPWLVPKRGDIIFYDKPWLTGHVAIVHEANKIDIIVLELNWATWTGDWKWYNAFNLETRKDYKDVLWWYRLK